MNHPRFLQIHTLHPYTGVLLNRDDSGLAKRIPVGGAMRTRISSQCLKRHWRMAQDDPHSLQSLAGHVDSFRSRELVTKKVFGPLAGRFDSAILSVVEGEFQKAVYGDKADKGRESRQTLLLGAPELDWLAVEAEKLVSAASDAKAAAEASKEWRKSMTTNINAFREQTQLPGGLAAALFGRMVTSDPKANIDAAIHVAHSFTVHAEETESDYFTAVDDLKGDFEDGGADTIQETELTSGLYYGCVVVDLFALSSNCGGDCDLAGRIVHNLIHLIAEVSPGAKRGSTAPYSRASFLLAEAGDRQPRDLSSAFIRPVPNDLDVAVRTLVGHLARLDVVYATGEERRYLSLSDAIGPGGAAKGTLSEIASWAANLTGRTP